MRGVHGINGVPDIIRIEDTDPDLSSGVTDPGYLAVNPESVNQTVNHCWKISVNKTSVYLPTKMYELYRYYTVPTLPKYPQFHAVF